MAVCFNLVGSCIIESRSRDIAKERSYPTPSGILYHSCRAFCKQWIATYFKTMGTIQKRVYGEFAYFCIHMINKYVENLLIATG